jgi:hypothetical protein
MELIHTFHTNTRREYGLLYLGLIQSLERRFFLDPKQVPIIAIYGALAKSYAADVMFYHILDGKDPMDIIDGGSADKMYLEEFPTQAAGQDCFADGDLTHEEKPYPVTLLFRNEPFMGIPPNNCGGNSHIPLQDLTVAISLVKRFKEHTECSKGGMIFASSSDIQCASISIHTRSVYEDVWRQSHIVTVNSSAFMNSEQFQRGWAKLKSEYRYKKVDPKGRPWRNCV